jgi:putative ABC transport system permease protein
VLGDVVEGSLSDAARTQYGPVDVVVTTPGARTSPTSRGGRGGRHRRHRRPSGDDDEHRALEAPQHDAAVPQVTMMELDVTAARGFGARPAITGLDTSEPLAAAIIVNERTADSSAYRPATLRLHAYDATVDLTSARWFAEVGLAGYGGAIVAPGHAEDLAERTRPSSLGTAQRAAADLPRWRGVRHPRSVGWRRDGPP